MLEMAIFRKGDIKEIILVTNQAKEGGKRL